LVGHSSRDALRTGTAHFFRSSVVDCLQSTTFHPHTRSVPVEPGQIEEYVLRLYPVANTFKPGHRLVVELSNAEPLADEHNALLPPDAFHLPVGRPATHKIYRDAAHHSRLVLPFTTGKTAEDQAK
jgi:predicted acyl esterase